MGNSDTKLNFRKAVVQLTTKTQPVEAADEAFWSQFWSESVTCIQDVFTLIPAAEIRALREENPSNLATLCYKAVEKLVQASETGCRSLREQQAVLNCVRLLMRILPYIFEDPDWRGFFWSTLPGQSNDGGENESPPLAQSLLNALCDLMFCPEFTVAPNKKTGPDNPEDMQTIDSCEYIWEAGVGFAHSPTNNILYDSNRNEILKLLLTCFSETMYLPPVADAHAQPNQWIGYFTSTENRHALPLFTSLLNVVCAYDPVGYGVPYNHLMFTDSREPLVESAIQVLCVTMDGDPNNIPPTVDGTVGGTAMEQAQPDLGGPDNLFVNYLSRIHREEDFAFILKGLARLLNNPLTQTYLPGSSKKIQFHQELLVLFWKMCDINKKFMFYVLKSSDVLDVLVPILYFLNDARADQSRVGLMHIGVFILLLLSGERNFGVRLNKPYTVRVPMDIPVFTGTHADFLIIVFHKIITTGHQRLQPLFDCLLTIIVNVSPYLKTLSMVACTKMLHLLEAFSTPWFLYASPTNHHLVFFLLEVFNNIIQYQFDGNSNLVYTIIRKRNVFHQLANLPTDHSAITRALTKRGKKFTHGPLDPLGDQPSMEGSIPAMDAEPGTLKVTLAATPARLIPHDKETRNPELDGENPCMLEIYPQQPHSSKAFDLSKAFAQAISEMTLLPQDAHGLALAPSNSTDLVTFEDDWENMFSGHEDLHTKTPQDLKWESMLSRVANESEESSDLPSHDSNEYHGLQPSSMHEEGSYPQLTGCSKLKRSQSFCSLGGSVMPSLSLGMTEWYASPNSPRPRDITSRGRMLGKRRRAMSLPGVSSRGLEMEHILREKEKLWHKKKERATPLCTILEESQKTVDFHELSDVKQKLSGLLLGIEKMTEKAPASSVHTEMAVPALATAAGTESVQPGASPPGDSPGPHMVGAVGGDVEQKSDSGPEGHSEGEGQEAAVDVPQAFQPHNMPTPPASPTGVAPPMDGGVMHVPLHRGQATPGGWLPTPEWVASWKQKLPLQTIMRLLQVLVPQVEKICIDKGLTDETEILKFLQHGTLVGLLPVPHPILIRKYQANSGTTMWFRTYMWGVIYLRNVDPPVWYDTDVKLFEIQRV